MKICQSSFKGPCYSHLKNGSQASICSANRSTSGTTSQIRRIPPQVGPLGGSPISSDAMGQPTHITHPHKLVEGEVCNIFYMLSIIIIIFFMIIKWSLFNEG